MVVWSFAASISCSVGSRPSMSLRQARVVSRAYAVASGVGRST